MKPNKIIRSGLSTINSLNHRLYARIKSASKQKAEITFIGEKKQERVNAQLFSYDAGEVIEKRDFSNYADVKKLDGKKVHWLNFHGIHDVKLFESLATSLDLDRITIRHIVDTTQRPKVDENDSYLFFTIKSILERKEDEIEIEQLSFVLGRGYLISFQEKKGDHFEHIRNRIRNNEGIVRKKECDYLLYLLLDAILDNYYETIDALLEDVAELEREVLKTPTQNTLLKIEQKKKIGVLMKKSLSPLREALTNILNYKTGFIDKSNMKYFRDLKNSCSNAIEEMDSINQSLEGLTNIYFSSLSHKMNEVMKMLTLVATIFIPLTFIVGIYGMNFDNMPELHTRYGYFLVLAIMALIMAGMIFYFKKKRWF